MTIQELLKSKSIDYKETSGSEWLLINCLWCGKEKLYIHSRHAGFVCFSASCGMKGKHTFLLEKLSIPADTPIEHEVVEKEAYVSPPPIDKEVIDDLTTNLFAHPEYIDYLKTKRGLSIDSIKKFKLGLQGRDLIIPVFNTDGDCINLKCRSNPLDGSYKSMWSLFGRGRPVLFNQKTLNKKNDRVIICEGELDCILLEQMGYSSVTSTGGCMGFKDEWIPLFERCEKIYICFDNDLEEQGREGALKTAKQFLEKGIKTWIISLPNPLTSNRDKVDVTDFFVELKKEKVDFTNLLISAQAFIGKLNQGQFNLITGEELSKIVFPPEEWIIDRFIPRNSLVCIGGEPGTKKSYLTNHMAACIATGEDFLGKFKTVNVPILFIDKENNEARRQKRFNSLGVLPDKLHHIYHWQGDFLLDNDQAITYLENRIVKLDIKLVFLDTLIEMHTGEENSASDMGRVFKPIKRLVSAGASVAFLQHFNKPQGTYGQAKDNIMARLRGSGYLTGAVDTYFALQNIEEGYTRLDFGKTRDEEKMKPFLLEIRFDKDGTYFNYLKDIEEESRIQTINIEEHIRYMLEKENPTRKRLIESFDGKVSIPSIDRIISIMKKNGEIQAWTNGKKEYVYILTASQHKDY